MSKRTIDVATRGEAAELQLHPLFVKKRKTFRPAIAVEDHKAIANVTVDVTADATADADTDAPSDLYLPQDIGLYIFSLADYEGQVAWSSASKFYRAHAEKEWKKKVIEIGNGCLMLEDGSRR